MKYSKFILAVVVLSVVNSTISLASHFVGFYKITESDTSRCSLNISEAQIPPLKDTIFNREKCLITHCALTLTNNSNDTLKYIAMSASWWNFYTLDNKDFALAAEPWQVFKNGVIILVLPPHQSLTKSIPIITYKDYYRGQKLRIAMSLQRIGFELPDIKMIDLEPRPKKTNMIWSNAVTIK